MLLLPRLAPRSRTRPPHLLLEPSLQSQGIPPSPLLLPNVTSFDLCNVGTEYTLVDRAGNLPRTRILKQMRDSFLKKIILSDSPSNDFVALSILCDTGEFAFCKKGDASWKFILGTDCFYDDAIDSNGFFYGLASTGDLTLIHLTGDHIDPIIHTLTPKKEGLGLVGHLQYLVHSGDRLLLVCRFLELDTETTTCFDVYTLNDRQPIPNWDRVDTMETHVIFLGNNTSFALPVSDFPGSQGNRVYFTDDHSDEHDYDHATLPRCYDMGIFNLKDETIQKMPDFVQGSTTTSAFPAAPIWVSPNPW